MNIGIVGLGLIGGSFAKAFKRSTNHNLYGYDLNATTTQYALMTQDIDFELTDETINACDYIFIATYPGATIQFIKEKMKVCVI